VNFQKLANWILDTMGNRKKSLLIAVSIWYPDKFGYRTAVLAYNRILINRRQRWRPFAFDIRSGYRIYWIFGPDIGHARNKDGSYFTILFLYTMSGPDISHSRNKDGRHMFWYLDRISFILGTKTAAILPFFLLFNIWARYRSF
jgi:hypothetical protein